MSNATVPAAPAQFVLDKTVIESLRFSALNTLYQLMDAQNDPRDRRMAAAAVLRFLADHDAAQAKLSARPGPTASPPAAPPAPAQTPSCTATASPPQAIEVQRPPARPAANGHAHSRPAGQETLTVRPHAPSPAVHTPAPPRDRLASHRSRPHQSAAAAILAHAGAGPP